MRNHLIIGLGGTGGRIIRALRKRVFQEHRNNEIPELGVEYLFIDSSAELMGHNDPSWKVLGASVQLPPGNQLRIAGANLREILENAKAFPGIQKWIGNRELWQKVPADVITSGAGGQRRRLGRFLFAMKSQEFRDRIEALVRSVQNRTQTGTTTFHVVTGLAGGTGSGALIDVITQISAFSTNAQDKLYVYSVLPDRVPGPGWDAGNYHANGYAALLELNGLMVRKYRPWDILRGAGNLTVGDILQGAYVVTNENENGQTIRVDDELPDMVGDFLYEILIESTEAQPPTRTLENFSGGPEIIPGTEEPIRARRFSSFGIKRVAVPEEEITEYLTINFSRQAILQLYFNNWDDRVGFREEPTPRNYAALVSEKDALQRWLLTDEHLTLQAAILPEDAETAKTKQWKPTIGTEWLDIAAWIQPGCAELPREERLNEMHQRFEEIFARGYRDRGVAEFYRTATAGRQKMARYIVKNIERELFDKWREGTYSVSEIGDLLSALRDELEERKKKLESKRAQTNQIIQDDSNGLANIRDEWADLGLISFPLKWKGIFEDYGNVCRDLFQHMTEAAALEFAIGLIPQTLAELANLKESVNQVTARFNDGLEEFKKGIETRIRQADARNFRSAIVKYFDADTVKTVVERLATNREEQLQHTAVVRQALIDDRTLGGELTFERFRERVAGVDLLDTLEQTCLAQARMAHDRLIQAERERILGVQLMNRLRDEYGGSEEKLAEFARNLVLPAKTFVRFNPTEVEMDPVMVGAPVVGGGAQKAILIKRPAPQEMRDFVDRLDRVLGQTDLNVRSPVDNHGRPHELSVLSFVGNFPLRYLEIVKLLESKYRAVMDSQAALARLELHTDDIAFELPDLYAEAVPKDTQPYLFLAEALGILQEAEDPMTGGKLFVARVGKGMPLRLGKSMAEVIEDMSHADFLAIKGEVDQRIARDYNHKAEKLKLQEILDQKLADIRQSLKGGDLNPDYAKHYEAMTKAEKILGVE
jgi:hypothetical protein